MDESPFHILLVEDDDAHAMMVERGIRCADRPSTVVRVRDGVEAVNYIKQHDQNRGDPRPHLILLDLKLPRMDGYQVLRNLKSDDDFKTVPVVILTTSDADDDAHRAYRLHANSYVVKPVNFDKFRQLIRDVVAYWGQWNRPPARVD